VSPLARVLLLVCALLAVNLLLFALVWGEGFLCWALPHRDIKVDDVLYLRRFYLTPRSWRWRVFLHHIARPDPDRAVHDHPWPFRTLVLRGWYEELVPGFKRVLVIHKVRWGGRRPATYQHRVWKVAPSTWTLVLAGKARRVWGFWPGDGASGSWVDAYAGDKFVPWRQYLGAAQDEPDAEEDRI
jgi:hypothetical protein